MHVPIAIPHLPEPPFSLFYISLLNLIAVYVKPVLRDLPGAGGKNTAGLGVPEDTMTEGHEHQIAHSIRALHKTDSISL